MLTLNQAAAQLADLKPGAFFLYEGNQEKATLGLVLTPLEDRQVHWITFTGDDAFVMRTTKHARMNVVPLGIDRERLRLRVDRLSAINRGDGYAIGRVVVGGGYEKAAIAATYHDMPFDRCYFGVSLDTFEVDQVPSPQFVFDRWSLSYIDDAGEWVDLVSRDSLA